MNLGSKVISKDSLPYIIAEVGVNHGGSVELAKKQIILAFEGGADAVKFQTYKAGKLASKNSPSYWDTNEEKTESQFKLFQKYDSFNKEDYVDLYKFAKKVGIDFLSTPFDLEAVDFLDDLIPFYKIASADITNIPLIRKIAKKQKPVLISSGASTKEEIVNAIKELNPLSNNEICILHCILNYPTKNNDANLKMISHLKSTFPKNIIGYSDHTLPDNSMTSLVTAYLLGAKVIEKHFTHDKSLKGNDHYHAMDKNDLIVFKSLINKINSLIGTADDKYPIPEEKIAIKNARRSIVAKKSMRKGHKLISEDLICKRPGFGISPIFWDNVVGSVLKKDVGNDELISWDDLSRS